MAYYPSEVSELSNDKLIRALFIRLLPIQVLMTALGSLNVLIAGLFASNYIGSSAMSAVGLYGPVSMIVTTLGTMMLGGTQVVCGRFLGKNEVSRTIGVFTLDVIVVSAVGLVLGAAMLTAAGPFAAMLGAEGESLTLLKGYLRGTALGILPQLLSQQLASFLALERQEKRTTVASVIFIVLNFALNWLFVVLFRMELFGLSLAASLSYWIYLILLSLYFFRKNAVIHFRPGELQWSELGEVLKIGYVSALSYAYQVVRGFVINFLLIRYGGLDAVAALAAYNTLGGLFWAFPGGVQAVYRILCSVSAGEEDRQMLKDVTRVSVIRYGLVTLALMLAVSICAVPITRIFYRDPTAVVYGMTVAIFRIYPPALALSLLCVVFVAYGQVMKRNALVHTLSFLDGLGGSVIFGFLLAPLMGYLGIWVTQVLNGVLTTVAIVVFSLAGRRHFPRGVEDLLNMPDSFGVPSEARMDLSVSELEGVVRISESIQRFCLDRGIDRRRAYLAGLCMEEMAGNVLEHGFTKDNRKHTVDVRVSDRGDVLILRIKDDCPAFNPLERQMILDPEDPCSNIGIRMVRSLASDMSYQNILGLNVLTVKI